MAQSDPGAGAALIGQDSRSANLYRVGAEPAPGIRIREVYADHVVLERDGVLLSLMIAQRGAGDALVSGVQPPAPPAGVNDMVRAAAAGDAGMPGIRVFPGRNRGAFAQMGLHPGDLVTEINGQPVGGNQASDLQSMIADMGTATVTVYRAGQLQHVTVHAPDPTQALPAQ